MAAAGAGHGGVLVGALRAPRSTVLAEAWIKSAGPGPCDEWGKAESWVCQSSATTTISTIQGPAVPLNLQRETLSCYQGSLSL